MTFYKGSGRKRPWEEMQRDAWRRQLAVTSPIRKGKQTSTSTTSRERLERLGPDG